MVAPVYLSNSIELAIRAVEEVIDSSDVGGEGYFCRVDVCSQVIEVESEGEGKYRLT